MTGDSLTEQFCKGHTRFFQTLYSFRGLIFAQTLGSWKSSPSLTFFSSLQTVSPPLARSTEPQGIMSEKKGDEVTIESLPKLLENDTKVKLAGVDVDGILRGKLISKKKFLGIAKEGFGFCSVIFGWDMHDQTYFRELKISNADNGYHDLIAIPDLSSFRRIPWEDDVPFFLVSFFDPDSGKPVSACPRGLLKTTVGKLHEEGYGAMAGGMFFQVVVNIKPG